MLVLAILLGYSVWSKRDNYHASSRDRISTFGVTEGIVTEPVYMEAYGRFENEMFYLRRLFDGGKLSTSQYDELTTLVTKKMGEIELRYREFYLTHNSVVPTGQPVATMTGQ